ncbi:ABC transporter permease [Devosia neptuniae]|jgi:peptide/nickel transport system permease protein|uniref:ABC transporter permease n=1 Tax=Devosia neptuniae TaxID=191302 RepID=A0ABY6CDC0_9HYPH|nr:ABC transporter permease [Devosia neptuniae]UXN70233.1 ABC transporter permease [Devosia neptuniae]
MNGYLTYVAKRFGQFIFVVFTGVTLAFLIAHFSPVDPIEQTVSLLTNFGSTDPRTVEILRQSLRELYGTDGSLLDQYLTFWGRVIRGDFGPSLSAFPTPVMTIIGRALPWTVGLLTLATIISWVVGNTLGAIAGYFRNNRAMKVVGVLVMAMQPIPTYITGLTLVIVFGFLWPILPISGGAQLNLDPAMTWTYVQSVITHGTLPALTLVLVGMGGWFIAMRSLVSNIVTDDYVVYAELGGVPSRTIFSQYVARNAMLPQITGLALSLGNVFGGAVIVEFIFNYPGIGKLMVAGIYAGDYSLVLGVTTISIIAVAAAVFLIDILYPLIDPRVKLG